ncbi:MAG: hypothetical protein HQ504_04695 [Rhodospirillaceae bacterium]|nr:hypothetical protein [Rhodospirillaceae bacterium]
MIIVRNFLILIGLILGFETSLAYAQTADSINQALLYKHPQTGYFITIPPGAQVEDRGENRGIVINSRNGFLISVQTGPTKSTISLKGMLAKLEQQYLGPGKKWSIKHEEQPAILAGLPAITALYDGSGTRIRVIIGRGKQLDYVVIFFAAIAKFENMRKDFTWMMESFRPAEGDLPDALKTTEGDGLQQMVAGNVRRYAAPGGGYSIEYPATWITERNGDHSVVFSGNKSTPAYFATISIQNVENNNSDAIKSVAAIATDMKLQITKADPKAIFSNDSRYIYSRGNVSLPGFQFTSSYTQNKQKYRQWTVVVARDGDKVAHVWSYAAPEDRFDRFGAIAGKMLDSWMIQGR